ncbi:uncharacterized protein LOC132743239 [Ruditapes philippinarum]|uniref:uncharacterized protein LOC132743239 n=1 Tax=Ruditapes philippinarum TaxID=129788 RepID=UPI00295C2722|nr:uncharacterized protein LOC132743239 [Ruditapes philippinarum]
MLKSHDDDCYEDKIKVDRQSPDPVNALFKVDKVHTSSQATSSQWQDDLESLQFSFEDSNMTSTQQNDYGLNKDIQLGTSDLRSQDNYDGDVCDKSKQDVITMETDKHEICDKSNKTVVAMETDKHETCDKSNKTVVNVETEKSIEDKVNEYDLKENEICNAIDNERLDCNSQEHPVSPHIDSPRRVGGKEVKDKPCVSISENDKEIAKVVSDTGTKHMKTLGLRKTANLKLRTQEHNASESLCLGNVKNSLVVKEKANKEANELDNIQKGVNTPNDMRESFELGSPNAHSTQINEIENIEVSAKNSSVFESTEENESQRQFETNINESEHMPDNTWKDSTSQNRTGIIVSQGDRLNKELTINDDCSMLAQCQSIKSEIGAEMETSRSSNSCKSSLSDRDVSVMLNYYSQSSTSSKSPEDKWHNMVVRLNDKRKKLQALKYLANRISMSNSRKNLSHEVSNDAEGGKCLKENEIKQEDTSSEGNNEVSKVSENINSTEELGSNCIEPLIFGSKDELLTEVKTEPIEDETEYSKMESTDTGYPIVSSSLNESLEESRNNLLQSDDMLEMTDLETIDRIHCETIERYNKANNKSKSENSKQSDAEGCRYSLKHDTESINVSEERQHFNQSQEIQDSENSDKLSEKSKKRNPFTPDYFEIESDSCKRSKRLVRKVISCREKDRELNSCSEGKSVSSRANEGKPASSKSSFVRRGNKYSNIRRYLNNKNVISGDSQDQNDVQQDESGLNYQNDGVNHQNNGVNHQNDGVKEEAISMNDKDVTACSTKESETAAHPLSEVDNKMHRKLQVVAKDFHSTKLKYVCVVKKHDKSPVGCKSKEDGTERAQMNSTEWTQIDDNILRRVSEKNNIQWKFKRSIHIRLERCDKKENICGKVNNKRIPDSCKEAVENENDLHCSGDDNSSELSKQNDTICCLDKSLNRDVCIRLERCDEKENICGISAIGGNDSLTTRENVSKKSDKTFRIPFSGYELTSDDEKGFTKESSDSSVNKEYSGWVVSDTEFPRGKKDKIVLSLKRKCRPVDDLVKTFNKELVGKDKNDHIDAETIDGTDCFDQDMGYLGVLKETYTESEVNVKKSKENDVDIHEDVTNGVINEASDNIKPANSEEGGSLCVHKMQESESISHQFSNIFTSPLQGTQPFEICQFPETQEFVPESPTKFNNEPLEVSVSGDSTESSIIPQTQQFVPTLSESLELTPLPEVMTTNNDKSIPEVNLSENTDKLLEVPFPGKGTSERCEGSKQLEKSVPVINQSENKEKSVKSISDDCESSKEFKKSSPGIYQSENKEKSLKKINDGYESSEELGKSNPGNYQSEKTDKLVDVYFHGKDINDGCESSKQLEKDLMKSPLDNPAQKHDTSVRLSSPEKMIASKIEPYTVNETEKVRKDEKSENVNPVTSSAETIQPAVDIDNDIVNELRNKKLNESADNEAFTKLIKKTEHQKAPNVTYSISSQGKTIFKVKPYRKMDLQRKRKLYDEDEEVNLNYQTDKKKQRFNKQDSSRTIDGIKQKEKKHTTSSVIEMLDNTDNSSLDDFLIRSPTKKAKTDSLNVNKDSVKDEGKSPKVGESMNLRKPCKTYEPRKIYIDGNCFGNKVFWQNFVDSPYPATVSCETKKKCDIEKTNKTKSSLDSSQGSEKKTSHESVKVGKSAELNRSSESLFSAENNEQCKDNSSPDSVSLIPSKKQAVLSDVGAKTSSKKPIDQTKLKEPVKVLNDIENKGTSSVYKGPVKVLNDTENIGTSSDLVYKKSDRGIRFYRKRNVENDINISNDVPENPATLCLQEGTNIENNDKSDNKIGKYLFRHSAGKDMLKDEDTTGCKNIKVDDRLTSIAGKKSSVLTRVEAVDKNEFIEDWLLKHKKIGEQTELSPTDSETLGVSLPSYQPVSAGCEQSRDAELKNEKSFCINDGLDEEQQGKDNSRCDSSSAESSDSVNSEDLKKPMSAAARYLLKFKKAQREKRKRNRLKTKLERPAAKLV